LLNLTDFSKTKQQVFAHWCSQEWKTKSLVPHISRYWLLTLHTDKVTEKGWSSPLLSLPLFQPSSNPYISSSWKSQCPDFIYFMVAGDVYSKSIIYHEETTELLWKESKPKNTVVSYETQIWNSHAWAASKKLLMWQEQITERRQYNEQILP
jgi:hypothetical protein